MERKKEFPPGVISLTEHVGVKLAQVQEVLEAFGDGKGPLEDISQCLLPFRLSCFLQSRTPLAVPTHLAIYMMLWIAENLPEKRQRETLDAMGRLMHETMDLWENMKSQLEE